jgi:hypothetical protein
MTMAGMLQNPLPLHKPVPTSEADGAERLNQQSERIETPEAMSRRAVADKNAGSIRVNHLPVDLILYVIHV